MNSRTIFTALAVAAVAVLWACAATASATVAVTSEDVVYTGEIVASSSNSELDGTFVTVKCGSSQVKGAIETHGESIPASGAVSSLTFSSCNYTVTVTSAGTLAATATSEGNGTLASTGASISIATSVGTCIFTTNNTAVGSLTGSTTTNATWDLNSSKIPRTGGNFLCGSSGTWTGSYTVTTPAALALVQKAKEFHFGSEKEVIDLIGVSDSPAQTFGFAIGEVACKKIETEGGIVAPNRMSFILDAKPVFKECSLGGEGATTEVTCGFVLRKGEVKNGVTEGSAEIFCDKGAIKVSVEKCTMEIPPQQIGVGLKKATYVNKGVGANREVTAKLELTEIKYTEAGEKCVVNGKERNNGTYTGSVLFKAESKKEQIGLFLQHTG